MITLLELTLLDLGLVLGLGTSLAQCPCHAGPPAVWSQLRPANWPRPSAFGERQPCSAAANNEVYSMICHLPGFGSLEKYTLAGDASLWLVG